ncbi:MAG: hypothetical protein AAF430_12865 [Myxococcota bacterium]
MRNQRTHRRESGYAIVWVLIMAALAAMGFLALAASNPQTDVPAAGFAGAFLVVAIGIAIEYRYDAFDCLKNTSFLASIVAVIFGSCALFLPEPSLTTQATAVVSTLLAVVSGVSAYRLAQVEEILPNPLLADFEKTTLRELNGVQFAVTHSDLAVQAGGEVLVHVSAQNGMSEPRSFELRLRPRALGKASQLGFDKNAVLQLPPGAAGTLSVPVTIHPKARGTFPIGVEPKVHGSGGVRWRVHRARAFSQRVSGAFQILALFGGVFVWGGGITLNLKVRKLKNWKELPVEEPAPSQSQLTYEPDDALKAELGFRAG